ncbi:MAG TPA: hypothetical protein VIL12_02590 [Acidimicrobiia bacterium]
MRFILRWTMRLAFVAAAALAISALINLKREWELLSESEIRDRLNEKLEGRLNDDQVSAVTDKVISYLKGSEPSFTDTMPTTVAEVIEDVIQESVETTGD